MVLMRTVYHISENDPPELPAREVVFDLGFDLAYR